jgi:two-component system chemotaxis sensor kinase CheA
MNEHDATIREFLAESYENLDQLERDLVTIEIDPHNRLTLDRIFRTIHSVKGACGFLAYPRLEAVAHSGEGLLCRLRDGELEWRPPITSALLALSDAMRKILAQIDATGSEGVDDHSRLIDLLVRLKDSDSASSAAEPCGIEAVDDDEEETSDRQDDPEGLADDVVDSSDAIAPRHDLHADHVRSARNNDLPETVPPAHNPHPAKSSNGNIRVDIGLLDKLMNLVGELVLARNQILQHAGTREDASLLGTSQRLNLITTELQEGVMKTRMQPIGNVWNKFPRVVRDLALACGKQVRLDMEGSGTELDRTIIEAIKDPLTHLLRNSVDHGIEPPAARLAAGKPVSGYLRLRAFHESGQVNIEISDDGAGIDLERITHRAVERGLISRDQVARMGDSELTQLIFLPGFSTADRVTNVSGRGVGMDVVKTNIEKIGGAIDVQSRRGSGMTVKIKIPLTLAIIPALIVSADGDHFAIPQVNLLELVHLEPDQAKRGIETIHGAPIFRLRGSLLPLVDLGRQLSLGGVDLVRPNEAINIVVLQADGRRFGLVVEGINDTEEIVVKPLGKQLKGVSLFAGATIMGDGRICLILDVAGIAHGAGVVSQTDDRRASGDATDGQERKNERWAFLLLRHGSDGRIAIPLSLVARLEEIPRSAIEHSADREVVQYRNQIIPLLPLSATLRHGQYHACQERDPMQVVVYSQNGRSVGLIVDEILDIVEDTIQVRSHRAGQGLIGSAVIQQRVTDVLDVPGLIQTFDPDLVGVSS